MSSKALKTAVIAGALALATSAQAAVVPLIFFQNRPGQHLIPGPQPIFTPPPGGTGAVLPITPFTSVDTPLKTLLDPGVGPVIGVPGGSSDLLVREDGALGLHIPVTTGFTSAVPEPSTWAMLLIGFAGLGWMSRRRRRVSAA